MIRKRKKEKNVLILLKMLNLPISFNEMFISPVAVSWYTVKKSFVNTTRRPFSNNSEFVSKKQMHG